MKDKFWNFVFYKFIFVFGVVNVQYLNEVRPCLQIKIHRVYLCNMWLARNHGLINPPLSTGGSLGVVVHRVVLFALALATLQRPIRIRKLSGLGSLKYHRVRSSPLRVLHLFSSLFP